MSGLQKRQLVAKAIVIVLALAAFLALFEHYIFGDGNTARWLLTLTIVGIPGWIVVLWLTTAPRRAAARKQPPP
jgi:hypothetical protein